MRDIENAQLENAALTVCVQSISSLKIIVQVEKPAEWDRLLV